MQREIKYRVWNKVWKCMYYLTGFKLVGKKHIQLFYIDSDGDSTTCTVLLENIILMQYTGLKDKNGKEIYENDLVEIEKEKYHFISEITWDETVCGFEFQDTKYTYCGLDSIKVFENGHSLYGGFVEVIGNIYENPELIKEDNQNE